MAAYTTRLEFDTAGRGFRDISAQVQAAVRGSAIANGLCQLFIRHTSASLLITENADPDVRHDLERFLSRLVPDGDPAYVHSMEGPDDMPAHVRSALTATSLSIPVVRGPGRLVQRPWPWAAGPG